MASLITDQQNYHNEDVPPCGLTQDKIFKRTGKKKKCKAKINGGEICGRLFSEHPIETQLPTNPSGRYLFVKYESFNSYENNIDRDFIQCSNSVHKDTIFE